MSSVKALAENEENKGEPRKTDSAVGRRDHVTPDDADDADDADVFCCAKVSSGTWSLESITALSACGWPEPPTWPHLSSWLSL